MRVSNVVVWLGVASVLACQEGTGPSPSATRWVVEPESPRSLVWSAVQTFSAAGSVEVAVGPQAADPVVELEAYAISFWVHADRDEALQLNYVTDSLSEPQPYLLFEVPRQSLWMRSDGSYVGEQDSVLISLAVDKERLHVDFEPSGLQFRPGTPARLQVWYGGANPDFNGDGAINGIDHTIEVEELGLWVQAGVGAPWERLSALHSVEAKWFQSELNHFSGYEVSY